MDMINAIVNGLGSNASKLVGTKSGIDVASATVKDATRANSSSTQPQSNINNADPSNKVVDKKTRKNKTKKSLNTKKDGKNKPSNTSVINSTFSPMHDINYNKNNPNLKRSKSSSNINDNKDNKKNILRSKSFTFSDSDSDVNKRTPDGEEVQEAAKNKKASTDKTSTEKQNPDNELVVLKETVKPMLANQKPISETKPSWLSKTISNALTSKHIRENKSAPDIKNAVMIYDTIDEAIKKKNVKYPYTKSFAQTKKIRKWFGKNNRIIANEQRQEKDKLQKSKDDAKTEAKKLVDELLKIDIDKIKAGHDLIIQLHIKIQDVEGGAKSYITKLENEDMNMKGGKRTRRKRLPVQKGGNNDDMEKKKKKLKIVNILKQLNSANYIDYEIESIIQELKKLLGPPSNVDTSIPETITTTTTIQEDMYSEPLPICTDKDKNATCKNNREKLENRLKYFNKLKELNAMHNDNELLAVAKKVIEGNKENINAYYEPYAKSDDTTNDKNKKNENYLKTLMDFTKIENGPTNRKIKNYNEIVDYLNHNTNKQNIVNPQLDEKLMTTNIKQTKTGDTIFSNILSVEHVLGMINNFKNNPTLLKAMNSTVDGKGDPGHTNASDSTEVKSTDIFVTNK